MLNNLNYLKCRQSGQKRGFTLIEMMVAVSIFVIVAFIVVSTLLTLSYSYKKSQKMRLLMDNLNFSVQSMSLGIREGVTYEKPGGCSNSDDTTYCFQFKELDTWINGDSTLTCFSKYERDDGTFGIWKCNGTCPCSSGIDIISSDINISNLSFRLTGGGQLKKVNLVIGGQAGKTEKERTNFMIQNTVAQRNIDS